MPDDPRSTSAADHLIASIRRAFQGVELGNGIGLWEAQAIDDYEDEAGRTAARARDETSDWSAIPQETLFRCESSLSFFDADGMRFHLPAFLISEIMGAPNGGGLLFSLTHDTDYARGMFTSLNPDQRKCVVDFLKWCLSQDKYSLDHKDIERALGDDWGSS